MKDCALYVRKLQIDDETVRNATSIFQMTWDAESLSTTKTYLYFTSSRLGKQRTKRVANSDHEKCTHWFRTTDGEKRNEKQNF